MVGRSTPSELLLSGCGFGGLVLSGLLDLGALGHRLGHASGDELLGFGVVLPVEDISQSKTSPGLWDPWTELETRVRNRIFTRGS